MSKSDTVYTTVVMDDGRIVEFAGKRKMLKTALVKDSVISVRLDFLNGESRTFVLPESMLTKFASYGAEQKLGDEIAGLTDIDDCVLAIDDLIEHLSAGSWLPSRGTDGLAGSSILARALHQHTGKPMADVKAFLSKKSMAEKLALRQNAAISPIVAAIEAEKASRPSRVNTEALLQELA